MLVSFGVLLLLILTKARNDQQQFNRPYGNDLSPNHPDYFSKSLHGRRNSIVYGIRPTDGTMAIFKQQLVDQIHDPEKVTALINASSSTNRFTFSQVYLVYRQGVIFMLLMTEEKVNRTTLTTVYNVKEFHRFIHPNSNRFTFSYDDYNSSLVELTRFEEETGARHVFRPVMQYYQNVTKFHGILDFNTEKRFSKLFMIQRFMTDVNYFFDSEISNQSSYPDDHNGFTPNPLAWCEKTAENRYGWIIRAQSSSAEYKYGLFAESEHFYHVDALYNDQAYMLNDLEFYSEDPNGIRDAADGTIGEFPLRSILVIIRKGFICYYKVAEAGQKFKEILNLLEYTHSYFAAATMPNGMQKVFAFSEEGEKTIVLALTRRGTFYRTYRTRPKGAQANFDCIPLNFGRKDRARKYGPPMIQLNINSTIISADYRPQIDVLYIYTEGRTYLLRGASTNLGELEETAADRIKVTDSFLYTIMDYNDKIDNIPWQIWNHRVVGPSKDGSMVVIDKMSEDLNEQNQAKRGDQIDYMLYCTSEFINQSIVRKHRYQELSSFYGVKGCTVFVAHQRETVLNLKFSKSGCNLEKNIKVFMSDGVLTVLQEDDAEQISYFRVLVKFSLERIDEPVFLDFDEKSFTGSITIVNGTFNHSFVQGDLLFHINRVDKADPCVIPYGFAHLVGERTVHSLRYIYKYRALEIDKVDCWRYKLERALFHQPSIRPEGVLYYVFNDGHREVVGGLNKDSMYRMWQGESKILNGQAMSVNDLMMTYRQDGMSFVLNVAGTMSELLGDEDVRFVAPYGGRFMRRSGVGLRSTAEIEDDLVNITGSEEDEVFEHMQAKAVEMLPECPPISRRYFMALVLKFLLVDLVLTLLLIIGILIHRMHIVPERRRTKIARGMAKAQQQRNMRERAMKPLAKILHPGEQSSSEVAEEVVIAAARQGPATLGSKIGTVVNANERNDALKNVDGALPATPVEGEKAVAAADGKQA